MREKVRQRDRNKERDRQSRQRQKQTETGGARNGGGRGLQTGRQIDIILIPETVKYNRASGQSNVNEPNSTLLIRWR